MESAVVTPVLDLNDLEQEPATATLNPKRMRPVLTLLVAPKRLTLHGELFEIAVLHLVVLPQTNLLATGERPRGMILEVVRTTVLEIEAGAPVGAVPSFPGTTDRASPAVFLPVTIHATGVHAGAMLPPIILKPPHPSVERPPTPLCATHVL